MEVVNDFTLLEMRIIQSLITKKLFSEIADVIEQPVEKVAEYVNSYVTGKNIVIHQQAVDNAIKEKAQKSLKKISDASRKNDLDKHKKRSRRTQEQAMINSRKKRNEPVFATKVTDYSQKRLIRINAKTCVYVDPDIDVAEFKRDYLERMNQKKIIGEKNYTKVKKFKPLK